MKEYVKPTISMANLSSSAPIANKSCTGDNWLEDYDFIHTTITNEDGTTYVNDTYENGST